PHRHLRSWHLPAPPKRGDGSRHYLPLSSEARADQGCRKRRNQVPDWSEITCRFPPKSPAAFDRNQVPVCSDFCRPCPPATAFDFPSRVARGRAHARRRGSVGPEAYEALMRLVLYKRVGEPDDIARAAVWLASD